MDTSKTMQYELEPLEEGLDTDDELVQEEDEFNRELIGHGQPEASQESSDDFGGDDFDTDLVEALETAPQDVEKPAHLTSYVTIPTEPVNTPPLEQHSPVAALPQTGSDDEFGIDDEDDFAADLEQVASFYDTKSVDSTTADQPTATENEHYTATEDAASVPVISLVDDDDDDDEDEFGDDIDADEFAAAEVAATQVPANTVRATQTYP